MTTKQYLAVKLKFQKKLEAVQKKLSLEFNKFTSLYIKHNCPEKRRTVYECLEGAKRRGYTRFVVYDIQVQTQAGRFVFIQAGGWWLDKNNVPSRWDSRTVAGVGNPTVFTKSADQTYLPHPESKKAKNGK